jgi:hypothetical protein
MTTYSRFQQGMIRVLGSALLVMGSALVGVGCEREGAGGIYPALGTPGCTASAFPKTVSCSMRQRSSLTSSS